MEVKATARYIRMSPRKVRVVADLVRGKGVAAALNQLKFAGKLAAQPISKALSSAIANARHNFELAEENLYVKEIRIDGGPVLKRWLPRAQGRATPLHKRMSHINITLAEVKDSGVKAGRKEKIEAPMKLGAAPHEAEGIKIEEKSAKTAPTEEQGKRIVDPRREGKGGGSRGFATKLFNRKSG